jgi:hypothetical protein
MAGDDDAREVERGAFARERRQMVDAARHVLERAGITPARRADPPIAEVPDRVAARQQRAGRIVELLATVRHAPEAAVQQADDRRRW